MARKLLLWCGVLASLLYAAMLVFIPMQWPAYSSTSQAVSELSAIDAPTRSVWVAWGAVYALLVVAFGWGVWLSAARMRSLRVAGGTLVGWGIFGFFWPPMHLRGAEFTLTDTLHIIWSVISVLGMLFTIGCGAAAFGKYFRRYSAGTILVFVVFGLLTFADAPKLAAGLPTPWLGVWERINILAYMLWVVVFAILLLRPHHFVSPIPRSARPDGARELHDFAAPQHAHADAVSGP
jgi:uncharacterized protein DUF998